MSIGYDSVTGNYIGQCVRNTEHTEMVEMLPVEISIFNREIYNTKDQTEDGLFVTCPYCGVIPTYTFQDAAVSGSGSYYIQCSSSRQECQVHPSVLVTGTLQEAAKVWNKRVC